MDAGVKSAGVVCDGFRVILWVGQARLKRLTRAERSTAADTEPVVRL
jgi:hypothetical protein